jgi:exodeoxyribonuclease VII large subunit
MVAASRADLLARVLGTRDSMAAVMRQRTERVRLLKAQFAAGNLERNVRMFLQPLSQRADYGREELVQRFRQIVMSRRHRGALASRELASYSPLEILGRGYAVVTHEPTGTILVSPDRVHRGELLSIRLARGGIRATVEDTHAGENQ